MIPKINGWRPASCSSCLNSLDDIEGFHFLWVTFGLQKFDIFSGDKIGFQRTSKTGF